MDEIAEINRTAWEHRAYEFWNRRCGTPAEKAAELMKNPGAHLRYHARYFENAKGLAVANVCGSNGRIAVPLALLGTEVTVFDISEENRRYALELARCAGVTLRYELGDFYETDLSRFGSAFDIAYMEGGILHYFHDLGRFTRLLHAILKPGGMLILSDFHPFRKILPVGQIGKSAEGTCGDYFETGVHRGDVAYKSFFPDSEQADFPDCLLRFYTLSEIINAVIGASFRLTEFNEHPHWDNKKLPGEFTICAVRDEAGH